MKIRGADIVLNCFLFAGIQSLYASYSFAQALAAPVSATSSTSQSAPAATKQDPGNSKTNTSSDPGPYQDNTLGKEFIKHLISDQKTIWTSPAHLRWADASWLFPLAAVTGGLFAT